MPLMQVGVRWSSSLAWRESGSWGRVTLNLRGRQSNGIVCARNFHPARNELEVYLKEHLPEVEVIKPEDVWDCNGVPPDLMLLRTGYEFTDYVGTGLIVEEGVR